MSEAKSCLEILRDADNTNVDKLCKQLTAVYTSAPDDVQVVSTMCAFLDAYETLGMCGECFSNLVGKMIVDYFDEVFGLKVNVHINITQKSKELAN